MTFYSYGISVKKVINQNLHNQVLREQSKRTSKYPPAFGIDIHIDDSSGLKIEGDRYNFATIIIEENDIKWLKTVLEELKSYSS